LSAFHWLLCIIYANILITIEVSRFCAATHRCDRKLWVYSREFHTLKGMKFSLEFIMKRFLTSCFGLGHLPIAPGTWGSMPTAAVFGILCYLGLSQAIVSIAMVVIAVGASAVCIAFSPAVIGITGKKDPGEVVADEAAGQAIVFIGAYAASGKEILIITAIGFLAFRLFDIIKPPPCKKLEKLPKGYGILADDLMAGVYAAIVLQICIRLWIAA